MSLLSMTQLGLPQALSTILVTASHNLQSFCLSFDSSILNLATATFTSVKLHFDIGTFLQPNIKILRSHVVAGQLLHVTSLFESDWRVLYSVRRHGPYTHLTRPLLAFCARGVQLARLTTGHCVVSSPCSRYYLALLALIPLESDRYKSEKQHITY